MMVGFFNALKKSSISALQHMGSAGRFATSSASKAQSRGAKQPDSGPMSTLHTKTNGDQNEKNRRLASGFLAERKPKGLLGQTCSPACSPSSWQQRHAVSYRTV